MTNETVLCAKCGDRVHTEAGVAARLCWRHLREARAACPPFVDGTRVTPGTEKCRCDGPCPECPPGKPRKNCPICNGYGTLCCEFPCWQRLGLTAEPCCPGCPPLDPPDEPKVADVVPIGRGSR